jgi:endonuclease III
MVQSAANVREIVSRLRRRYPRSRTALEFETPFQILVATILSAQCTDERVNLLTPALYRRYPTVEDFAAADREELERMIRPAGFFRNKAKHIMGSARAVVDRFGGRVPAAMSDLLTLPGVARKTANIVLSAAFGRAEGIAVDTHVRRIAGRLGLSGRKNPDGIERDLMAVVPEKDWLDFNFMLVEFGRDICQARKPRCSSCPLQDLCPSAGSAVAQTPTREKRR